MNLENNGLTGIDYPAFLIRQYFAENPGVLEKSFLGKSDLDLVL